MKTSTDSLPNNEVRLRHLRDQLVDRIYYEKPVDPILFLTDKHYLGVSTNGGQTIYPGWLAEIKKIFGSERRYIIILTGGIGCYSGDTEYLSPEGWKKISEYTAGKVAQFNLDGTVEFVQPKEYIKKPCDKMIRFHHQAGMDQLVSDGHRVLTFGKKNRPHVMSARDLYDRHHRNACGCKARILTAFKLRNNTQMELTDDQLRLQIAAMADGWFYRDKCHVRVKKERKIKRMWYLLRKAGVKYHYHLDTDKHASFTFSPPIASKNFTKEFWAASFQQREVICSEVPFWDGTHKPKGNRGVAYFCQCQADADFIQYCFVSVGRRASILKYDRGYKNKSYVVRVVGKGRSGNYVNIGSRKENAAIETAPDGFKYCFEVPSSFLVMRRNGCVFVSGNTGKTTIAVYCMAYVLYRMLCLKDPWGFFGKSPVGKMCVSFFNLTKSLAQSKGYGTLMEVLSLSPWFQEKAAMTVRRTSDIQVNMPLFEWALYSPYSHGSGGVSKDLITALLDELDSPNESMGQKKRVMQAYESGLRRFESRFVVDGASLGKIFLVSSKQDELSFLEAYAEKMKDSPNVLVIDKAPWEVKHASSYSGETFRVCIGDAYHPPKIIENEDEVTKALKDGFDIETVPVEYQSYYQNDIVGALRDFSGIAVRGIRRYKLIPSETQITACFDESKQDPIGGTIMTGLQDDNNWYSIFQMDKLRVPLHVPRALHLDIAFQNDALALSSSCVSGWVSTHVQQEDGSMRAAKAPVIETDFVLRVKAKEGDRIPLDKVRKFILDLKASGMRIMIFTADLVLASEDTMQILAKSGIPSEYFSVDRDTKAYMELRNLILEKRWVCHRHKHLLFELKHLEFDRDRNKIDHPDHVQEIEFPEDGSFAETMMEGSKDCCLSGDTQISLLNGTEVCIKDLVGKIFEVYSCLPDGSIKIGMAFNVHSAGMRSDMLRVYLDNGFFVDSTSDHKFMLRDGTFREAKDLLPGDSLMPLYRKISVVDGKHGLNGYEVYLDNFSGKWCYTHQECAKQQLGFSYKGTKYCRKIIHHKDFNKRNNSSVNLCVMDWDEHRNLHNKLGVTNLRKLHKDPKFIDMNKKRAAVLGKRTGHTNIIKYNTSLERIEKLKKNGLFSHNGTKVMRMLHRDPQFRIRHSVRISKANKLLVAEGKHIFQTKPRNSYGCIGKEPSPETKERLYKIHSACGTKIMKKLWADPAWAREQSRRTSIRMKKYWASYKKNKAMVNHKVARIQSIASCEVFDMSIDYGNFALSTGVFVHNSDSVAASVYNALIRAKASLSDADEIQKGLDRMGKRPGALGLAPDWFVLDEKKVGKDGKPVSVLFDPDQKAKAVVDGLQKLRGLKGI